MSIEFVIGIIAGFVLYHFVSGDYFLSIKLSSGRKIRRVKISNLSNNEENMIDRYESEEEDDIVDSSEEQDESEEDIVDSIEEHDESEEEDDIIDDNKEAKTEEAINKCEKNKTQHPSISDTELFEIFQQSCNENSTTKTDNKPITAEPCYDVVNKSIYNNKNTDFLPKIQNSKYSSIKQLEEQNNEYIDKMTSSNLTKEEEEALIKHFKKIIGMSLSDAKIHVAKSNYSLHISAINDNLFQPVPYNNKLLCVAIEDPEYTVNNKVLSDKAVIKLIAGVGGHF